jgi:hypothetical protein
LQVHGGQALDDVTQFGIGRERRPMLAVVVACPSILDDPTVVTSTHAIARLYLGNSGIKPQIRDRPNEEVSRHGGVAPLQHGRIGTPMDGRIG